MPPPDNRPIVQIDIVSDIVCPWCVVGFRQLDMALQKQGILARLRWHPFELNPDMPPEGQNLREHIMAKYGSTAEQSQQARDKLTSIGAELGFAFNFDDDSRIGEHIRGASVAGMGGISRPAASFETGSVRRVFHRAEGCFRYGCSAGSCSIHRAGRRYGATSA